MRSQSELAGAVSGLSLKKYQLPGWLGSLGPAFMVSIAYIDPGNFAANIAAGSAFGYRLLWVIVWSNLMAIFLQVLSAKLGIAAGKSLPACCVQFFPRPARWLLGGIAVTAAMATDLTEFLGAALGMHLLLGWPLGCCGLIAGFISFLLLLWGGRRQRAVELAVVFLLGVVGVAYLLELLLAEPGWVEAAKGALCPSLPAGSAYLVVGMLGATVMPHVIFLHSQLVQPCHFGSGEKENFLRLRQEKINVALAMNLAMAVNLAMVIMAAAVFYRNGISVTTLEEAHFTLAPLLGPLSSVFFGIALLAAGFSSAIVGTLAGQLIMEGFTGVRLPAGLSRLLTMAPAMLIIASGTEVMYALLASQIVLSLALPAVVVPLLLLTGSRRVMGGMVNSPVVQGLGWLIAALVCGLDVYWLAGLF